LLTPSAERLEPHEAYDWLRDLVYL
jgi:hypothetical protein